MDFDEQRATDLFNKVAFIDDVLAGLVRNSHGNNVGEPLRLVDDGVGERQVLPVLDSDLTASHHPGQLLLDLVWVPVGKKSRRKQDNMSYISCYSDTDHSVEEVFFFFCTLKMRVLGHEKQTPLECDCRRVRPRCKQIQHAADQVVLMIE